MLSQIDWAEVRERVRVHMHWYGFFYILWPVAALVVFLAFLPLFGG